MMDRRCFLLRIKPEMIEPYKVAHANVWPDMQDALRDAGWANYSLFLNEADGLVVGYLETKNWTASLQKLGQTEANTRWQAEMAPFFEGLDGVRADKGLAELPMIFHLD